MSYLADTWTWADLKAELLLYLGLTEPLDPAVEMKLQALLTAAIKDGDQYMNNPFKVDSDGKWIDPEAYEDDPEEGSDVVPSYDVKIGLFEWVRLRNVDTQIPASGQFVSMKKTGDLQESYGRVSRSWDPGEFMPYTFWNPYRLRLSF